MMFTIAAIAQKLINPYNLQILYDPATVASGYLKQHVRKDLESNKNASVCLLQNFALAAGEWFHMIAMSDVHVILLIHSIVDIEPIEVYLSDDGSRNDRHDS